MPHELHDDDTRPESHNDEPVVAGTPVVVRRHAGVSALIGAAASAVAIAYLWRASQTMAALDWGLCAVMAVVAAYYLTSMVDSRTPLLVADDLGVRIRLGHEWRGLPWEAIGEVAVHPRRGLLRDGRVVVAPRSLARALEGLDAKGRRHASLNQKMYGAALAVPVGVTTRISTRGERSVVDEIAALAHGRADVVDLAPAPAAVVEAQPEAAVAATEAPELDEVATARSSEPELLEDDGPVLAAEPDEAGEPVESADTPFPARRSILGGIGTIVSRVAKGRRRDLDADGPVPMEAVPAPSPAPSLESSDAEPVSADVAAAEGEHPVTTAGVAPEFPAGGVTIPLRPTRPALRAEVTRDVPAALGNAALQESLDEDSGRTGLPEARELRRPGSVDLVFEPVDGGRVRPISQLGDPVDPLVIDDFVTEPAYDPVIGPELAASRTRLGLTVDELADRTRIRPHVIESIEVDDFAPCGGDFYARGHLRTLARVLGKDPEPLLETFEERYATAPINARRVFEAELATGMTGSMRSTIGGPNWGLLIGVVLSLVLVWGVVRLFAGEPAELVQNPAPVLNGSAGIDNGYLEEDPAPVVAPLPVMLTAAHGDTKVVVRDGAGRIVFSGPMVLGEKKRLEVTPPVRIRAADGGAVEVAVHGRDRGVLGEVGRPGRRTFR